MDWERAAVWECYSKGKLRMWELKDDPCWAKTGVSRREDLPRSKEQFGRQWSEVLSKRERERAKEFIYHLFHRCSRNPRSVATGNKSPIQTRPSEGCVVQPL